MSAINDGVFFVGIDHPVCKKCVSSLDREDRCDECGGDGWVERDDGESGITTCPECFGAPSAWYCPTCHRRWPYSEIRDPDEDDE